jgi:hypothetical protein
MFQQLLLVLVIQFGLAASALAEPSKPTGEALRQVVSGRTILLDTPIGTRQSARFPFATGAMAR